MKIQNLLSLLVFMFSLPLFSQQVNRVPLDKLEAEYIEIYVFQTGLKGVCMNLDYGQAQKVFPNAKIMAIRDDNGENILFNSPIAALNLMRKYGYVYIDSYILQELSTPVVHYILRRE